MYSAVAGSCDIDAQQDCCTNRWNYAAQLVGSRLAAMLRIVAAHAQTPFDP